MGIIADQMKRDIERLQELDRVQSERTEKLLKKVSKFLDDTRVLVDDLDETVSD